MTVNLWTEAAHAESYLEHRKLIPRRAAATRRCSSSCPSGRVACSTSGAATARSLARVLEARPGAVTEAIAADFSAEMLGRVRRAVRR